MINSPMLINCSTIQEAWLTALSHLHKNSWRVRNLVVHISGCNIWDDIRSRVINNFLLNRAKLNPKRVAYTIFPFRLFEILGDSERLYNEYNKQGGFYDKHYSGGWGTYFQRMTAYPGHDGHVNQLKQIIESIRGSDSVHKARYTMIIQSPGGETIRPLGGPCLNYISLQIDNGHVFPVAGLLAVYRNHDFIHRAYGNYWGLYELLKFICRETKMDVGPVTCVSSTAYVEDYKRATKEFIENGIS